MEIGTYFIPGIHNSSQRCLLASHFDWPIFYLSAAAVPQSSVPPVVKPIIFQIGSVTYFTSSTSGLVTMSNDLVQGRIGERRNWRLVLRGMLENCLVRFSKAEAIKRNSPNDGPTEFRQFQSLPDEVKNMIFDEAAAGSHLSQMLPTIGVGYYSHGEDVAIESKATACIQALSDYRSCLKRSALQMVSQRCKSRYERHFNHNQGYIYDIEPCAPTVQDPEPIETSVAVFKELVRRRGPPIALSIRYGPRQNLHERPLELLKKIYNYSETNDDGKITRKIEVDTLYVQHLLSISQDQLENDPRYLVMRLKEDEGQLPTSERGEAADDQICNTITYEVAMRGNLLSTQVLVAHMVKTEGGLKLIGAPKVFFGDTEVFFDEMKKYFDELPNLKHVAMLFHVDDERLHELAPDRNLIDVDQMFRSMGSR